MVSAIVLTFKINKLQISIGKLQNKSGEVFILLNSKNKLSGISDSGCIREDVLLNIIESLRNFSPTIFGKKFHKSDRGIVNFRWNFFFCY